MRWLTATIGIVVAIVAIVAYASLYVVDQRQQAVVLQLGALVRVVKEPGLTVVVPFFQNVRVFDKRIQPIETDAEEIIIGGNTRIVVDAFARYKIVEPVKYIRGAPSDEAARQRLMSLLISSLRAVLGRQDLSNVQTQRDALMRTVRDRMQQGAKDFGIDIVDVRIRRADLPAENQDSVFNRMKAERKQAADKFRAEGDEQALQITSAADKDATIIRAEAKQKAEGLRGEGEAERNRILGEAYGRDPEFFEFYRSLKAYEQSMSGDNTTMVISPDGPFFKYFQKGQGAR